MNYYERHIGDYLKDTSHLSLLEHGVYTRLLDVYYTREGGIPEADAARLIGARSKEERAALSSVLAEFFELREGSHWQGRAEREIERFKDKQSKAKRSAEARWGAKRPDSEGNANASAVGMRTHSEGNAPRARPQSPVTRHQTPEEQKTEDFTGRSAGAHVDPPDDAQPTAAGLLCRALADAGIGRTNPGHPRLQALLQAGATSAEFLAFADKARDMDDPFAYLLGCVEGERKRAKRTGAEVHKGRLPSKQEAIEQRNRAAADEWLAQQGAA